MFTLERLEAALLARWGREEMTVYADYLQSIGDPRGEAIAIDLVNLDTVNESAWRARREEALAAWLGADLASKLGGHIFQGFVQEASGDEALLDSPAGDYVRAFRCGGDRLAIERLTSRPRPWLMHLAITAEPDRSPLVDDTLVEKLVAATPRLDELVLRGRGIMQRIEHPNVRLVRLDGPVLDALGWGGEVIAPPKTSFAIERLREVSATAHSRLHLTSKDSLAVLDEPSVRRHVTHVRFTAVDSNVIVRALALPRLAVIEVAASDRELATLRAAVDRLRPEVTVEAFERYKSPAINPWR